MLHVAIELCRPGDIVVVACASSSEDGMFGELLATLPKPILAFCRSGTRSGKLFRAATGG